MKQIGLLLAALGWVQCLSAEPLAHARQARQASRPRSRSSSRGFSITNTLLDFTVDLSTNQLEPGNVIFSPFSIANILNLLLMGTSGNTYEQLRVALKYPFEVEDVEVHRQSGVQLGTLRQRDNGVTVYVANRIFIDGGFRINKEYMKDAEDFYQASVEQLEFGRQPAVATRRINQWVRDKTNGKIGELFGSPVSRNTRMIGTNVVYFNGSWAIPFDPEFTSPRKFAISDRETVQVDTMFGQLELPFADYPDEGFKVLGLPYQGFQQALYIFLPDQVGERAVTEVERRLSAERMLNIINDLRPVNISVWLPRFKMQNTLSLRDALQAMGATDLFQESRADLTKMSPDRDLFLSEVVHEAVIEVHEKGTEAAAATTTLVNRFRGGKEFRANRPFLFVLRENRTGVPLFWGRLVRPEPSTTA